MIRAMIRRRASVAALLLSAVVSVGVGCASTTPRSAAFSEDVEIKKQALDLYLSGKTAEAKGNREAAIAFYFEARQYDPESVEIAVALAKAFLSSGKQLSALHFAQIANELDPANMEALTLLQYLFQQNGDIEMAARALEMMVRLTPNPGMGMIFRLSQYYLVLDEQGRARRLLLDTAKTPGRPRGEIADIAGFLEENGFFDDAASIYSNLIARNPGDVEAWAALGGLQERTGDTAKARETFRRALAANPGNVSLHVALGNNCMGRNEWDCAISYFEKARQGGFDRKKIRATLAALYYYAGQPVNAEALRDSVIAAGEDDAQFYFFLGKAMLYRADYGRGAEYYRTGFAKPLDDLSDDQKLTAYLGFTRCLVRTGNAAEALRVIQENAVQNIRDPQYAKDIEASLYMELKRYDDAAATYQWLMDADPENLRYLIALTQAYNGAEKYAESESLLQQTLEEYPENTRILMQLAIVYDLMKDTAQSEEFLRVIIKKEPKNALALNNLAYMYIDSGRNLRKAMSLAKRALAIDPDNGAYLDTMGWGYFRRGDLMKARGCIEKALEKAESDDKGVIYDHYGDILFRMGQKEAAADAYRKAIEFGEDAGKMNTKIEGIDQ